MNRDAVPLIAASLLAGLDSNKDSIMMEPVIRRVTGTAYVGTYSGRRLEPYLTHGPIGGTDTVRSPKPPVCAPR